MCSSDLQLSYCLTQGKTSAKVLITGTTSLRSAEAKLNELLKTMCFGEKNERIINSHTDRTDDRILGSIIQSGMY